MPHVNVGPRVDPSEGRAKIVELDINGKQAEGPRRFVHINRRAEGDLALFHDHINPLGPKAGR